VSRDLKLGDPIETYTVMPEFPSLAMVTSFFILATLFAVEFPSKELEKPVQVMG
jgi:hypothetical protein